MVKPARNGPRPPPGGAVGTTRPARFVRVERRARRPSPWIREIREDGEADAVLRAGRGYASAEAAWEAGRAALLGPRRAGSDRRRGVGLESIRGTPQA